TFRAATMMRVVPVLLFLTLLLGPSVPQETEAGRDTLTYFYIGVSKPRKGLPAFQANGFLNEQTFLQYDSTYGKAEPVGPWRHVEGMEDWEKESQLQKARQDIFLETLQDAMNYYNSD
ncbi:zinc-alpha-2-glycoprotein-like, partial [Carlito syrichta]|uniref:Zinc-alpha-2-glycoprotein-like n=1 Tax=Carlito syrichta TaxID=1868482 RepID=A0A1U7STF6_CARSF